MDELVVDRYVLGSDLIVNSRSLAELRERRHRAAGDGNLLVVIGAPSARGAVA